MTDEEADAAFEERAQRMKLNCCICDVDGWLIAEEYVPMRNMLISSCGDDAHALCISCFSRISTDKMTKALENGQFLKRVECPFPYSRERCNGGFRRRCWEQYVSYDLLMRRSLLLRGRGYSVRCSSCKNESLVEFPELQRWNCSFCRRSACGRCDSEDCYSECLSTSQYDLENGYSRTFSENIASGGSRPLRRKDITAQMVLKKILEMQAHAPWFHAQCPSCDTAMYKSSACNDMKHCGKTHVCYFCLERSFPWENGTDLKHWNTCPRWDHDLDWFPCRYGVCHTDSSECKDITHAPYISRLHVLRWEAAMNALKRDVGSKFESCVLSLHKNG